MQQFKIFVWTIKMKMYFGGTYGIKKPLDFDGNEINVGDELTFDYLDPFFEKDDMSRHINKATYKVKMHENGKGMFAEGINQKLYLHDFRFEYCRIIKST